MNAFKDQLVPVLADICSRLPGTPDEHVKLVLDSINDPKETCPLTSIEIVACLDAAISMIKNRKPQPNDMLDLLHATQSVPHCDAVCCDRFMAHTMRNKPLDFQNRFEMQVFGAADEIEDYLVSLLR